MIILDGKQMAIELKQEIAIEISQYIDKGYPAPHLAIIVAGDDSSAETYLQSIVKSCKEVGMIYSVYRNPKSVHENEFKANFDFLNNDDEVHGYIVQMPLPPHLSTEQVVNWIVPSKDIDCLNPSNIGKLITGNPTFLPATPNGTLELIKRSGIKTEGKHCVVVGRSAIVGKPLALLLAEKSKNGNATVTICHSKTKNLKQICSQADILLVAIGQPEMIDSEYVKEGATVIDIGIHRVADATKEKGYRICGDVNFDDVVKKAEIITPVPGGVGPMTNISLLLNTLKAYKTQLGLK